MIGLILFALGLVLGSGEKRHKPLFAESTLYVRRAFIEVAGKGIIVTGSWLLVESMASMGVMNGSFHDILSGGSPRC